MNKSFAAACALPVGLALALAVPLSASAHVSASATSTAAGSYTVITFSVPHGCDGSATTSVAIDIPEGIDAVTPTVNPNWSISRTLEAIPDTSDGSQRTSTVTYAAAVPLAADQRDTFELSLRLPDGEAGDVVEFPVLQTCEIGQTVWDGDEVPSIVLTAAVEGDEHGHGSAQDAEHDDPAMAVPTPSEDGTARVLGGLGLALGTIGLAFGITTLVTSARRKAVK